MLGEVLGGVLFGQPCAVEELALQQGQVGLWGHDSSESAAPKAPSNRRPADAGGALGPARRLRLRRAGCEVSGLGALDNRGSGTFSLLEPLRSQTQGDHKLHRIADSGSAREQLVLPQGRGKVHKIQTRFS